MMQAKIKLSLSGFFLIHVLTTGILQAQEWKFVRYENEYFNAIQNARKIGDVLVLSGAEEHPDFAYIQMFLTILDKNGEVLLDTFYPSRPLELAGYVPEYLHIDTTKNEIIVIAQGNYLPWDGNPVIYQLFHLDFDGNMLNSERIIGRNITRSDPDEDYRTNQTPFYQELKDRVFYFYISDGVIPDRQELYSDSVYLKQLHYDLDEREVIYYDSVAVDFQPSDNLGSNRSYLKDDRLFCFVVDTSRVMENPRCERIIGVEGIKFYDTEIYRLDRDLKTYHKMDFHQHRPKDIFNYEVFQGYNGDIIRLGQFDSLLCGTGYQLDVYIDRYSTDLEFQGDYLEGSIDYLSGLHGLVMNEEKRTYTIVGYDYSLWDEEGIYSSIYEFDEELHLVSKNRIDWRGFRASNVLAAEDAGEYYVIGSFEPAGGGSLFYQGAVVKVDQQGNILTKTTNLEERPVEGWVKVYPNPASDKIEVEISAEWEGSRFSMYNSLGVLVFEKELVDRESYIHQAELPSGNYIYRIEQKDQSFSGSLEVIK